MLLGALEFLYWKVHTISMVALALNGMGPHSGIHH